MKQIIIILLASIMSLTFLSCRKVEGEGPVVTETRNETGFNGVAISVPADVVYQQASNYKIEIRAQRNILDLMESTVINSELRLRFKENVNLRSFNRVTIYISSPDIYNLSMNGSGSLNVTDPIITPRMRLAISGSGNINIDSLKSADNIETVISGSGNITVKKGSSLQEDILVSGSGKVDMEGVVTNKADANIRGSGDVRINVQQSLNIKISGSGDIYYKGSPSVNSNVSGSGKVIKI
jgi:hypothetical protein